MRVSEGIAATAFVLLAWCSGAEAQTFVTQPMAGMTDLGQRVVVPAGTQVQILDCRAICTVAVSGFHLLIPPQFLSDRGGARLATAVTTRQVAPKQAAPAPAARPAVAQQTSNNSKLPTGDGVIPFDPGQ